MKKYNETKKTTYKIEYYFVLCSRLRRKIFNIPGVKDEMEKILKKECPDTGIELQNIAFGEDYIYIYLECCPDDSPVDIINRIKNITSKTIRDHFEELKTMPNLWSGKFFVSTDEIPEEDIEWYVKNQKTRS